MPRPQCEPCCAPEELARNIDTFRPAQLQIACSQLDAALEANILLEDILLQLQTGGTAGTQYPEGDVVPVAIGNVIMWKDVGDVITSVTAATPLPVNVVAGGTAGVQYTDGDVDATVTGTAVMWKSAGNVLQSVSAAFPLPTLITNGAGAAAVNIQDGGNIITVDGTVAVTQSTSPWVVSGTVSVSGTVAVTQSTSPWVVSGTVTANAGTNLNTSLLALEAGGNLAAAAASLAIIDNIVSGSGVNISQINGVTPLMGNGPTGTGSLRVTIADNNSPVPTTSTSTPAALTAASPAAVSVGATSTSVLGSATYRRIEFVNTSNNTISIGIGAAAVLNSGVTLKGDGSSYTLEGPITAAINAIASVAASNLTVQAFT